MNDEVMSVCGLVYAENNYKIYYNNYRYFVFLYSTNPNKNTTPQLFSTM